ncbi:hypothetical protein [Photorhabdus temperata]|uniref:Uncharacterized protein n=1 Tax=Photorhabdus temperata J3 TaxID=1389415 RepID=U7QT83_PHOTE|nr:hypothetical protein [Photorhabdus temperata]ERT10462.1 hypothetical protein O185_24665 [Photorhabdus temperata J3]
MINIKKYLLILLVTLISGCADPDAPLSPPKENQWITVEGVVPKYTQPYVSTGELFISPGWMKLKYQKSLLRMGKVSGLNILTGELKPVPKQSIFDT